MSDDYEVGYGKPPKHSQFRKGQSGNPKGRPKGSRNFSTDLKATLAERVRVTKGGKAMTVSTQLATLLRLREKALAGDERALGRLIELARLYNDEEIGAIAGLGSSDSEVLDAFLKRQQRRSEVPSDDAGESATPDRETATEGLDPLGGDIPMGEENDDDDDEDWLK